MSSRFSSAIDDDDDYDDHHNNENVNNDRESFPSLANFLQHFCLLAANHQQRLEPEGQTFSDGFNGGEVDYAQVIENSTTVRTSPFDDTYIKACVAELRIRMAEILMEVDRRNEKMKQIKQKLRISDFTKYNDCLLRKLRIVMCEFVNGPVSSNIVDSGEWVPPNQKQFDQFMGDTNALLLQISAQFLVIDGVIGDIKTVFTEYLEFVIDCCLNFERAYLNYKECVDPGIRTRLAPLVTQLFAETSDNMLHAWCDLADRPRFVDNAIEVLQFLDKRIESNPERIFVDLKIIVCCSLSLAKQKNQCNERIADVIDCLLATFQSSHQKITGLGMSIKMIDKQSQRKRARSPSLLASPPPSPIHRRRKIVIL